MTSEPTSQNHPAEQTQPDNLRLSLPQDFTAMRAWPERIIVEPARLAMGIWGYAEGDICAAYCADTLPKAKAFVHDGRLFVNTGGSDRAVYGYPLLSPEEFNDRGKQAYSYEGREVTYQKRKFILGPKVEFASRPLKMDEAVTLLRRMYAHGGYFVSGRTYLQMLQEFRQDDRTAPDRMPAIEQELTRKSFPQTQAQMLTELDHFPGPVDTSQLGLPGM